MREPRLGTPLVWAVPVAAAALGVAALVVHARAAAVTTETSDLYLADAWVAMSYPVAGAWLAVQRRTPTAAAIMLAMSLLAVAGLGTAIATFDAIDGELGGAGQVAAWLGAWTWAPYLLIPTALPLAYLEHRSRAGTVLMRTGLWLTLAVAVVSAVAPGPVNETTTVENPLGVGSDWVRLVAVLPAVLLLGLGPATVAVIAWHHLRRPAPGTAAALVGSALFLLGALSAGALPYPWDDVWTAVGASVLPLAFVIDHYVRARQEEEERLRSQLILARDEERRRLRQDLHDGLAPRLAGLGLRVEQLAEHAGRPADRVTLEGVSDELRESVTELRAVVDGLTPQAVARLGLVGAVRACAERLAPGAVELAADDLPPLSTAIENAAYPIVSESLRNAARHARATRLRVELRAVGTGLRVSVSDDGVGGASSRAGGLGLGGIAARAEALGGWCRVGDGPGAGTVVEAFLPWEIP